MASVVVLPKQGNSVESCVIKCWLKQVGDAVKEGDGLCEVETDKATVEVPATASGILLAQVRAAGDDVPVQTAIAVVGAKGDDVSSLIGAPAVAMSVASNVAPASAGTDGRLQSAAQTSSNNPSASASGSSPRARAVATAKGVDIASISGTGPNGLVIERDVQASAPRMTPAARAAGGSIPATGSGLASTITVADRAAAPLAARSSQPVAAPAPAGASTDIPVKSIRKIIAERMRHSIASTAQLTLNTTAKAVALQALRVRYKAGGAAVGQPVPSVNDLILLAVARTLVKFPAVNAHFLGDRIRQFSAVHLGVAVDTERGLLVPVLRDVQSLSLAAIGAGVKALAKACQDGKASPEQLSGSTFTVTNLGAMGIDHFTPVLNVPEVAILGVGGISLKAYDDGKGGVEFLPALALSLTIDHQGLDGAPAARFLQALVPAIENIDLVVAA